MFKVTFSNSKVLTPFDVSKVNTLEEAVSLALALHRSSNCPHVICVYQDFEQKISFELFDVSKNES